MPGLIQCAALILVSADLSASATSLLDSYQADGELPGVTAAIVTDANVVWEGATGNADLAAGTQLTTETPLYAGSLSKVFTAGLALALVADDKLDLDRNMMLREGRLGATPRQLLSHAAGLPREGNFGYWFSGDFPNRDALYAYLAELMPTEPDESRHRYSNIGYAALGLALEETHELQFSALLDEYLLQPLGLRATGTGSPPANIANGYTPPNRIIPSAERPFAGVGPAVGERFERQYHHARAMTPAFGIYSTSGDIARLAAHLIKTAPTPPTSGPADSMFAAQPSGWGLGIGIVNLDGRQVGRHSGWFAAHRSSVIIDVDRKIAVVVMANSDDGAPGGLATALYRLAVDEVRSSDVAAN